MSWGISIDDLISIVVQAKYKTSSGLPNEIIFSLENNKLVIRQPTKDGICELIKRIEPQNI